MNITDKMFPAAVQYESNTLQASEFTLNHEVASNLSVDQPSDSPTAFHQATTLRSTVSENNEYLGATNAANTEAQATYNASTELQTIMSSVGELMTEMNSTTGASSYKDYGNQMAAYASQIAQLANTQTNGVYLFGGTSNQAPLTTISPTPATPNAPIYQLNPLNNNALTSYTINDQSTASAGLPIGASNYSVAGTIPLASPGTVLAADVGTITVNGTPITVVAGDTLNTVATKINTALGSNVATVTSTPSGSLQLNLSSTSTITATDGTSNLFTTIGLNTANEVKPTSGFLSNGSSSPLDTYTLVATLAQDLQNSPTGSSTDPFANDTTLQAAINAQGNASNSISGAIVLVNSASSLTAENVGKGAGQLTRFQLNTNNLNNSNSYITNSISVLTTANVAAAATSLTEVQTAYSAALSSASKILNLNVLQYLN